MATANPRHDLALAAAKGASAALKPNSDEWLNYDMSAIEGIITAYLETRIDDTCECGQEEKGEHDTLTSGYATLLLHDIRRSNGDN